MALEILLILVAGGIATIAVLLQALGYSRADPFTEETARAAWARHEPDIAASAVHLSGDGMAALVETARGPAIVWHMGADATAHWLAGANGVETANGLRIDLHDFAAPSVRVTLSPETAAEWQAIIGTAPKPQEPSAA
jgi:hypothetical protein